MTAGVIRFIGGKGGVGKTTVAAAWALRRADAGERVLLISTDPAHSLTDALETDLGDRPAEVTPGMWVAEPDADAALSRRVKQVTDDAYAAVPREIMPAVHRHLERAAAGPGMAESALADLLIDYMSKVPTTWDQLVVDSAPTGHLLRMLDLPALLTPWVRGLARQRERSQRSDRFAASVVGAEQPDEATDPLLERLHHRRRRLEAAAERLRTDAVVHLVTLPRRMVLAETLRAARSLEDGGISLGTVIINQVPPHPEADIVSPTEHAFAAEGTIQVGWQRSEPTGLVRLRELGTDLYLQADRHSA